MKKVSNKHLNILGIMMFLSIMVQGQIKVSQEVEQQIDSIFSSYKEQPGCAIAIVKNGETLFQKGYGLANLSDEIPVTDQTVFDANAFAKQVTAACIFLLEQEGKLSLTDPIQKFFPDFPSYEKGTITVQNLLYQTSGLRSYLAILYSKNQYFGDSVDNEDVINLVSKQKNLNLIPGGRNDLSNSNYVLLSNIIEKVSEKPMALYAKQKLFDPLNMKHTFFLDNPNKVIKNRALAYQQEGDDFVLSHFFNPSVIGDGGLQSSLEDLVKWTNNLSSGVVGGKELVNKMVTPGTLNSGEETNYAGGLFLQNHYDIEELPSARHSGEWAGFRSLYYKFLNLDTAFIILSNNANTNVWGLLDQLTPFFLADEIAEAQEKTSGNTRTELNEVTLKIKEKQKFDGSYYDTLNGIVRSIELKNDTLLYKRSSNVPGTPLIPISKTELVFQVAPQLKLSFDALDYSTMTLTVNNQASQTFQQYERYTHSKEELKEYEQTYYNEDCDVIYQIIAHENGLKIMIENEELVSLTSMARDMFREEHFGYIKFFRDNNENLKGFIRQDNTFTNLKFNKVETPS